MIEKRENKIRLQKISIILCLIFWFIFYKPIQTYAQELKSKISLTPSYIIGPWDQLTITDKTLQELFGQSEKYDVTVASDGYISVPLPDGTQQNVLAAGDTLDKLATDIRNLFGKTLKNPLVFTQISRYRPINVYISGEVAKPGVYKIESTTTLLEGDTAVNASELTLTKVIQLAGGLKPRADITSVVLIRGLSSDKKVIDLKSFFNPESSVQDLSLQSGDTVYVPKTDRVENQAQNNVLLLGKLAYQEVPVSIVGEVKTPGGFIFSNDSTLFDALGKAGGLNVIGTLKKIKFSRYDEKGIFRSQELNIDELLQRGIKFEEIALRPNDVIEIESSKRKEARHLFRNMTK